MSLSTYHADEGTDGTEATVGDDGAITLDTSSDGTVVSDDGSTIVTTEEAEGNEDADKDADKEEGKEEAPAVEPSDPTLVQTFGDSSDAEDAE
jgi:hypothetical protein